MSHILPMTILKQIVMVFTPLCSVIILLSDNPKFVWETFNSYTMATRNLPDIYAQTQGPQA